MELVEEPLGSLRVWRHAAGERRIVAVELRQNFASGSGPSKVSRVACCGSWPNLRSGLCATRSRSGIFGSSDTGLLPERWPPFLSLNASATGGSTLICNDTA
jgi:hypothetical protein